MTACALPTAGAAAGVELGLVSAFMAQRVLGQYDVALIGPSRPARLLFVAPNLAEAQRRLGAEREPFLRWVALHEATHVVLAGQFGLFLNPLLAGTGAVLIALDSLLVAALRVEMIRAGEHAVATMSAVDPRGPTAPS